MSYKETYRSYSDLKILPIFYQPWWLDQVCGKDKWNVVLVENENGINGILPYYEKRSKFFTMPELTPYLGPFLLYPEQQNYYNQLKYEKDVMKKLIDQLPSFNYFSMRFPIFVRNWLPFYWEGFQETTRYTYVLKLNQDIEKLFSQLKENVRRNVKKAQKYLSVVDGWEDITYFHELLNNNLNVKYSSAFLREAVKHSYQEDSGKLLAVKDDTGQLYCAMFMVWDENYAYYLLGARDPKIKDARAMSLLMWEAIKFAKGKTNNFDFEGSMIKPIERFFRSFGTKQHPYFHVHKYNSMLIRSLIGIRGIFNKKYY